MTNTQRPRRRRHRPFSAQQLLVSLAIWSLLVESAALLVGLVMLVVMLTAHG